MFRACLRLSVCVLLTACVSPLEDRRFDNHLVRMEQNEDLARLLPRESDRDRIRRLLGPRVGLVQTGSEEASLSGSSGRAAALTSDGYFLTAWHVVSEGSFYLEELRLVKKLPAGRITLEQAEGAFAIDRYPGRIVWSQPDLDLALVEFPGVKSVPFRKLGAIPQKGALVCTSDDTGFGFYDPRYGIPSLVGNGSFLAAGQILEVNAPKIPGSPRILVTDLVARGGMSGAPLSTPSGTLLGIITRAQSSYFEPQDIETVATMVSPELLRNLIAADRRSPASR
ncbi:MAG: serine protease [Verrucomicrobiota bacterium]